MGCAAVRGRHLAPALWQSPCMADDLTVRPIRAEEWRRVRDLRLAALQDPEILAKLKAQGLFAVGACGDDDAAFTRKQFDDYGRGIREANIKPN